MVTTASPWRWPWRRSAPPERRRSRVPSARPSRSRASTASWSAEPGVPSRALPQRIVLVGFMGCGKSTVGAELARRLGWGFRDLDRWIEARRGLTVARIFRRHGEAFFREEERRAARAAARLRRHVVAAGGGAFAQEGTREILQKGSLTVWLRCDAGVL